MTGNLKYNLDEDLCVLKLLFILRVVTGYNFQIKMYAHHSALLISQQTVQICSQERLIDCPLIPTGI